MKTKITNLIYLAIVSLLCFSCDDGNSVNSLTHTISPVNGTVWTGRITWKEDGKTMEGYINLGMYPMEKSSTELVYGQTKERVVFAKDNGHSLKKYEHTFVANGYFSCTVNEKTEDGSIGEKIFQVNEGFCFYSGNALHLISKYSYKRVDLFNRHFDGLWSIVASTPTSLVLKHQDSPSRMTLVPLQ